MANQNTPNSAERNNLDRFHFIVGFLVLTVGVYVGAFAVRFLLM